MKTEIKMKQLINKVLLTLIVSGIIMLVLSTIACAYFFSEEWAYIGAYSLISVLILGLGFAVLNPDLMRM